MRKLIFALLCTLAISAGAQTVTRTQHRAAIVDDAVTTGSVTIRKPDYICISTAADQEQLIMDGTMFTMKTGGKNHVTDSRKNRQFATFHQVLKAVINHQPVTAGEELTVNDSNGLRTITVTPAKKKRQMFTSFVLVIDSKTWAIRQLRMNERAGNYVNYEFW